MTIPDETPLTLIDDLLAEQQRLTAVERFARQHDAGHAQALYYRELLPTSTPRPGQQYAFAVDLDACTGCKSCVSACHSLNGLDDEEVWRNVGALHGGDAGAPYLQTVTTACHHCLDPACLDGCPVMAYDKDMVTGVVRHLDDQCIGCQYCVLKCPYDVPKYSVKRGIVRKCDMCAGRLAEGEAPACVQACPTQAIRIEVIDCEQFERALRPGEVLVPGAFDSTYTKPTTRYRTTRTMPDNVQPCDAQALRLAPAHWPLIFMLVLTQMAVGMFASLIVSGGKGHAISACAILHLGLAVSVLHLGRPRGAWRFLLGLRSSWMSREILAFAALAGIGALCAAAAWSQPLVLRSLATATALAGAAAVYCSAMIYIDTRRPWWRAVNTLPKFFGTALLLGAGAAGFAATATVLRVALYGWEGARFLSALRDPAHIDHRPTRTMWALRRPVVFAQFALYIAAFGLGVSSSWLAALAATFAAQIVERYLYFTAMIAPRMPGGVAT